MKKGEDFSLRAIKAYKARTDKAPLILSRGLKRGESLVQAPATLPLRKELRYPLDRTLVGPQGWSEPFGQEKNLLSIPRFETRTVHPVA